MACMHGISPVTFARCAVIVAIRCSQSAEPGVALTGQSACEASRHCQPAPLRARTTRCMYGCDICHSTRARGGVDGVPRHATCCRTLFIDRKVQRRQRRGARPVKTCG